MKFIFELNALFFNKSVDFQVDCRTDKLKYLLVLLQVFFCFFFFTLSKFTTSFSRYFQQFLQSVGELCSYHSGTKNYQADNCVYRRWVRYTLSKTSIIFLFFMPKIFLFGEDGLIFFTTSFTPLYKKFVKKFLAFILVVLCSFIFFIMYFFFFFFD